jgi:hypothetical protein
LEIRQFVAVFLHYVRGDFVGEVAAEQLVMGSICALRSFFSLPIRSRLARVLQLSL